MLLVRIQQVLIYLDQNFVSNLTKLPSSDWDELSRCLDFAVSTGAVSCVESSFHAHESAADDRISIRNRTKLRSLTNGVVLADWSEIMWSQLNEAARSFIDNRTIAKFSGLVRGGPQGEQIRDRYDSIFDGMWSNVEREFKDLIHEQFSQFRKTRIDAGRSFDEEREHHIAQLIRETFMNPALVKSNDQRADSFLEIGAPDQLQRQFEVLTILTQSVHPEDFWTPSSLGRIPVLNIFASLFAADITMTKQARPSPSFNADLNIASIALPVVNAFATDRHMARLIRDTRLDRAYDCQVFTPKHESVRELIRTIRNAVSQQSLQLGA